MYGIIILTIFILFILYLLFSQLGYWAYYRKVHGHAPTQYPWWTCVLRSGVGGGGRSEMREPREIRETQEFSNLPSDTLIKHGECFICRRPINREHEYLVWTRSIEKMESGTIGVLVSEEMALICSRKCYEELEWAFSRKG